jgi:hypothetical protein
MCPISLAAVSKLGLDLDRPRSGGAYAFAAERHAHPRQPVIHLTTYNGNPRRLTWRTADLILAKVDLCKGTLGTPH